MEGQNLALILDSLSQSTIVVVHFGRENSSTPDATLSFRVAFEPKDSYIFARGQNIGIILPKPKELFELFGFEAKKRVRTATKI